MQYTGTVTRIQRTRDSVTLIVETDFGLRGIELDAETWNAILADAGLDKTADIVGWRVAYNPSNGDLDVFEPLDDGVDNGSAPDAI